MSLLVLIAAIIGWLCISLLVGLFVCGALMLSQRADDASHELERQLSEQGRVVTPVIINPFHSGE